MNSRELNHLAKNPRAMMDYKLRGKLPRSYEPTSPLITLLEQIPASIRGRIQGVQVHPMEKRDSVHGEAPVLRHTRISA